MKIEKKLWITGVEGKASLNAPYVLHLQERLALGDKFSSTLTLDATTCEKEHIPLSLDLADSNMQIGLELVGSLPDKGYYSPSNIVVLESVTRTETANQYGNRSFCIAKFISPQREGTKFLSGMGPVMRACPFYELQLIVERIEYERLGYHAQNHQFFRLSFLHIPREEDPPIRTYIGIPK